MRRTYFACANEMDFGRQVAYYDLNVSPRVYVLKAWFSVLQC